MYVYVYVCMYVYVCVCKRRVCMFVMHTCECTNNASVCVCMYAYDTIVLVND